MFSVDSPFVVTFRMAVPWKRNDPDLGRWLDLGPEGPRSPHLRCLVTAAQETLQAGDIWFLDPLPSEPQGPPQAPSFLIPTVAFKSPLAPSFPSRDTADPFKGLRFPTEDRKPGGFKLLLFFLRELSAKPGPSAGKAKGSYQRRLFFFFNRLKKLFCHTF